LGGTVRRVLMVPDELPAIEEAVKECLARGPDWLVTTGGLGPTYDDVTLEGVSLALGVLLEENLEAKEMVLRSLSKLNMGADPRSLFTPERAKMARLPSGSIPLSNPVGTAPGALVKVGGTWMACLPGVPAEMKAMFLEHIGPRMARGKLRTLTVEVEVVGVPEAVLAPFVLKLARTHPSIYVKSHPRGSEEESKLVVQLTGRGEKGVADALSAKAELTSYLESRGASFMSRELESQ